MSDRYVQNVQVSSDGIISWDPYPDATHYDITINTGVGVVEPGDRAEIAPETGRLERRRAYHRKNVFQL